MIKEFNSLEEIQKYYDYLGNTYVFAEDNVYIDVVKFNFNLNVKANIKARNINALNIDYYGVCFAYRNIKCKSIKGKRENAKHFVLDGKLKVEKNDCIIDTTLISKEYSEK